MIAAPLAGRRVLVTRALEDSTTWAKRLTALGAVPVILPCIRSEMRDDAETRALLVAALRDAGWLCITSARGAEAVARLAGPLAPAVRVAAVGESTANAVRAVLCSTPFVARGGTSRALGEELLAQLGDTATSTRVVVAGAGGGRTDAEQALERGGVHVTRVDVYRMVPASKSDTPLDLHAEGIGDVLLASPSAVEGFLNQTSRPVKARIFTIGSTTSAAVAAAGLTVSGEAAQPDFESLVEAMQ